MQRKTEDLEKETLTYGKPAYEKLKNEYDLREDELKQAQAVIQKLTFQLEDKQASTIFTKDDQVVVDLEKAKIQIEELQSENAILKSNANLAKDALREVQALTIEVEEARKHLAQIHKSTHQSAAPSPKQTTELQNLRDALQREANEKHRIETDNLRLMEKIRLLNARRSISEAEAGKDFFNAFKQVTLSSVARTAFVNGSMTKKCVSIYFLLIHLILFYKLFL